MTSTRRRYTAKERAQAVGIASVEGVTEAERVTGIPKETVQYWTRKPEFAQLRTTAREVVIADFWAGIQIGASEIAKGLSGDAPLKDKAQAVAVLVDKYALLSGQATVRTETLTAGLAPEQRARLRGALVALAKDETA